MVGSPATAVPAAPASEVMEQAEADQEAAASEVMAQLEASDQSLEMGEIDALKALGPTPWTSFGGPRNRRVIAAWRNVASQLPSTEQMGNRDPIEGDAASFVESEQAGVTGRNDTVATGDRIDGFGTGEGEARVVTISGWLEPAVEGDGCEAVEDDGSIATANDVGTLSNGIICAGEIGDGPHGSTTGDVDFYRFGEVQAGQIMILDVAHLAAEGTSASMFPAVTVLGIYDADGNRLASAVDTGGPNQRELVAVRAEATGQYYGVVAGCCELPTDPTDPTKGGGIGELGSYDVVLAVVTPDAAIAGSGRNLEGEVDPRVLQDHQAKLRQTRQDRARAASQGEGGGDDVDVFLVDLEPGDAIAGGFDNAAAVAILDPRGELLMAAPYNPSFIYPATSPLRHDRLVGFDHVATVSGPHAVLVTGSDSGDDSDLRVTEGGPYEGELRVVRAGRAEDGDGARQIIFVDFDGAPVNPALFGQLDNPDRPEVDLSPLADFLGNWGLQPSDEDAVIDEVLNAMVESLDDDLRVVDGRQAVSSGATDFDIQILNSRDHADPWGEPNVSRVVIGGTIDELGVPSIGIAESIDPGNQASEETGVVMLDVLSEPAGSAASINSYEVGPGETKSRLVGHAIGHVAAHEVGHFIGNWHTETFNSRVSLMDAGGEFESVFGTGPDRIFGTADDIDADFAVDTFNMLEGFAGTEDTIARSFFALASGGSVAPGSGSGPTPESGSAGSGSGSASGRMMAQVNQANALEVTRDRYIEFRQRHASIVMGNLREMHK